MDLPRIKRRLPVYETETLSMGTYNRSDNIKPGDILDSYGLSSRRWPLLATRRAWKQEQKPGDTTSIFAWDGHRVRVTGGLLYYDDKPIENVSPGDKQFAVVGTKLIVWPDKLYIDVTNGSAGHLDASVIAETATISANSVTADLDGTVAHNILPRVFSGGLGVIYPGTYTYGKDPKQVNFEGGKWVLPTPVSTGFYTEEEFQGVKLVEVGDILIPSKSGNSFDIIYSDAPGSKDIDTSKYNDEGYYAVVSKVDIKLDYPNVTSKIYLDIFSLTRSNPLFSATYAVGDAITITGTIGGYNDADKAVVKEVKERPNSLVFADKTFREYRLYGIVGSDIAAGEVALKESASAFWTFTTGMDLKKGWYLFRHADTMTVWDPTTKKIIEEDTCKSVPSFQGTIVEGTKHTDDMNVRIERPVPDMDFICEKDNRLWGCSNKTRTIYASSLGLPDRFWDYEGGLATNSYAVAVGSEGDFTACAPYRNTVVFFKEDKIHRVTGDFPAQYRLYKDIAEGVAAGSYKSIQHIAGLMYYLGTHGVYSYNGGSPVLISYNLGDTHLSGGISGNDGDTYYLSAMEGDKPHLLMYETKYGIWVHDGNTRARDFARIDRTVYMCQEDGSVQNITTEEDDPWLEWMAQLCPYWDTLDGRKTSESLTVRMELPSGSWLRVLVRYDGGKWQEATRVVGSEKNSVFVPLPVARADKTEIKLEGKGPCAILSMLRRFRVGSPRK